MLSARSRLRELTESETDNDGILYASSPGEKAALENARRERRRRKIVKELFETEKAYLNHLDVIHKYFFFPLRFNCILPEEAHAQLFSNIEQIHDVNRKLLELMEQNTVGQAFKHLGPFLKLYAMYANNHEQALSVLQDWTQKSSKFAEFVQMQEARPEVMGLKINALLITPVQRVPRYKLLLENLLEHTSKDHHDFAELKEATKQIEEIARHINEHIRQHENFQKMLSIQRSFDSSAPKILQPGRVFLKEGPLKKVSRKGAKAFERMFFLFNDVLLYGKPKLVESGGRSYTCCCVLPVKHCKLERVFVTTTKPRSTNRQDDSTGAGVFKITCKEESLVLYSDDTGAAEAWSNAIEKAIRKANDDRQTLRKPSSNKIPLRGRSLRKHRQQQKKSAVLSTPVRRKHPKPEPEDNKDCCSPQLRKRVEPFRERILSLYDNLPSTCASPPRPGKQSSSSQAAAVAGEVTSNRFSVISEGGESLCQGEASSASGGNGQRGSLFMDDENFDSFAMQEDLMSLEGSIAPGSPASHKHSDSFSGSVVSTTTGTEIYFPRGSTLALNGGKARNSVRSKIKSYLSRPFTRLQRARQTVQGHCSSFTQRCSTVNASIRRK